METVKQQAIAIIDNLPEGVSWDEVMYEIYVRASIKAGLQDVEMGRVLEHDEVMKRLDAKRR
ncbi:MAG: hypothetical protein ABI333_26110 [bacterium]